MKASKSLFGVVAILALNSPASAAVGINEKAAEKSDSAPSSSKTSKAAANEAEEPKKFVAKPAAIVGLALGANGIENSNGDYATHIGAKLDKVAVNTGDNGMVIIDTQGHLNLGAGTARKDREANTGLGAGVKIDLGISAKAMPTTCAPIVTLGAKGYAQGFSGYGAKSDLSYRAGAGLGCTFSDGKYILFTADVNQGASGADGVGNYQSVGGRGIVALGHEVFVVAEYAKKKGEQLNEKELKAGAFFALPHAMYLGLDAAITDRTTKDGTPVPASMGATNDFRYGVGLGGAFTAF